MRNGAVWTGEPKLPSRIWKKWSKTSECTKLQVGMIPEMFLLKKSGETHESAFHINVYPVKFTFFSVQVFIEYVLCPGTVLNNEDRMGNNNKKKVPAFMEFTFQWRQQKKISK